VRFKVVFAPFGLVLPLGADCDFPLFVPTLEAEIGEQNLPSSLASFEKRRVLTYG
jgi:hypothetical protein